MIGSRDRILTTHVGSLPRTQALGDLLIRQEAGEAIDAELFAKEAEIAVRGVVERQLQVGIDIGNDGEQPRVGFQTYVVQRMQGFGGESKRPYMRDFAEFPSFAEMFRRRFVRMSKVRNAAQAIAEVTYPDLSAANEEIALFERVTSSLPAKFTERFMTAPSPGIIATTMMNAWYDSHEAYVAALAREIAKEYRAIHAAGLVLQIDAPDLAMERNTLFQDKTEREFLDIATMHIAAMNGALEGIPRDRVRLHCCWGNNDAPHVHDIALATILPVLFEAKVGALSIEFANPRHQHEYEALKRHKLPAELMLLPGVLDTTTNIVEHPEVVARRTRGSGGGRRRPRAGHRQYGLRLRHLHRLRVRCRGSGVGKAQGRRRRRAHRLPQVVGKVRGRVRRCCAGSHSARSAAAGRPRSL